MPSVVSICNQALFNLGDEAITSMTQNTRAARLCNGRYESVRNATLRAYPWNCVADRRSLAQMETDPSWGYDHQYAWPADCLRVLEAKDSAGADITWKSEGRKILTDSDSCYIRYIRREEDPNQYDALLCEAIAARLAAEIAYPLTGSRSLAETMWGLYDAKKREAENIDAQEGTPEPAFDDDAWLEARE
jgi:hypothetical protein